MTTLNRITHDKVRDACLELRDTAEQYGASIKVLPIRQLDGGYSLQIMQGSQLWEELSGLTAREAFLKVDGLIDGLRMIGAAR